MEKIFSQTLMTSVTILAVLSTFPVQADEKLSCGKKSSGCLCYGSDDPNIFEIPCSIEDFMDIKMKNTYSMLKTGDRRRKVLISCLYSHLPKLHVPILYWEMGKKLNFLCFSNPPSSFNLRRILVKWSILITGRITVANLTKPHLTGVKKLYNSILINEYVDFPDNFFVGMENLSRKDINISQNIRFDMFKSTPMLTTLILKGNDLSTLPAGIFKPLSSLMVLNLNTCNLLNLTSNMFNNLEKLEILNLEWNNLETLPVDIFRNLPKLRSLNLGLNKLTYIPENLLSSNTNLEELIMRWNKNPLTLPEYFLRNLTAIKRVILPYSKIQNLTLTILMGLTHIEVVDLEGNALEEIPANVFCHQKNMIDLNLSGNQIHHISNGAFKFLKNLKTLNLKLNQLTNISKFNFQGLESVINITLSQNKINYIDDKAFQNLSQLEKLDLSNNNISFLSSHLQWNTKFTEVNLAFNEISNIFGFKINSPNFKLLDLTNNTLLNITAENFFVDQESMTHLILNNNKISHIADGIFEKLKNLTKLSLKSNKLTIITKFTFHFLHSLTELDLSRNEIESIDDGAFSTLTSLEILNLSYNRITSMEKRVTDNALKLRSPFQNLKKLTTLDLRHNNISTIIQDWRVTMPSLKRLDLSSNAILRIGYTNIKCLNSLILNLAFNHISEIDFKKANEITEMKESTITRHNSCSVKIDNNPINCDCNMIDLYRFLKRGNSDIKLINQWSESSVVCSSPAELKKIELLNVDPNQLICPFDDPESATHPCPEKCSCYRRTRDSFIVNCSATNPTIPFMLPNVTGNYTNIELHFENNNLQRLSNLFTNKSLLDQINRLYVSGNNITSLSPEDLPNRIQVLDLRNNQLVYVSSSVFNVFSGTLQKLDLSGNQIACNCENMKLLTFIRENLLKVQNLRSTNCSDGTPILNIINMNSCGPNLGVIALNLGIAFVVLLAISTAIYYKYKQEIKVWMYARRLCLRFITESEIDGDKIYDAFLSYSHEDEDFVVNELLPKLEEGSNPFKICIHMRDWTVGEFIQTQIVKSVQDSRRTVIVLSHHFIKSVWGIMEFRIAHSRALKEGRARVIIILYEDVGPTDDLDPELRAYLTLNTYVKWGDPFFWNKLRYALPHRNGRNLAQPPQMNRENSSTYTNGFPGTSGTHSSMNNENLLADENNELINIRGLNVTYRAGAR